jgi:hypothetical protein
MKVFAAAVGVVLVFATGAVVNASDAMKAIVGSYLEVHAALASDKIDGVKPAAKAIADQAARMGASGEPIAKAAKELEQAADIKAARTAFGDLSDAVITAAKAEGWKDVDEVKLTYCPMSKKHWLQKDATIRNPYYGASMLTCGEFKQK